MLGVPIVLSPLKFQQKLERENDELRVGCGGGGGEEGGDEPLGV